MEYISLYSLIFFFISLFIYLILPKKIQWIGLLLISIIFYILIATPFTFIYIILSVISVYLCSINFESSNHKKRNLIITIIFNFLILSLLKYLDFIYDNISLVLKLFNVDFEFERIYIISSIGISFYTLQLLAYLIDCYWNKIKPEHNFFKLLLFTCYFPQIISGPISRYSELNNQLFEEHRFDYKRITYGLIRLCFGVFQILVVSNRLEVIVDTIMNNHNTYSGVYIWVAILIFPLQLYTNFSGCMDMIMGVSECFGIYLPENFRAPFFSKNTQEFWQRWHITLGSWLKDYILFPILKSNKFIKFQDKLKQKYSKQTAKSIPTDIALLVLWICMGIWHGSGWKFILGEGLWFWFMMIIGKKLKKSFNNYYLKHNFNSNTKSFNLLRIIRTYLIFCFGMIFFRANDFHEILTLLVLPFKTLNNNGINVIFDNFFKKMGLNNLHFIIILIGLYSIYRVDKIRYKGENVLDALHKKNSFIRWFLYLGMILLIILSLSLNMQEFIYAQF